MSGPEAQAPLSDLGRALLLLLFGVLTTALVRLFDAPGVPRAELLALASGSAAFSTALVWFFALGLRRSASWALAMLVPYVNLIAVSYFARRYWSEGARPPALLALAGLVLQTLASIRLIWAPLPTLV